MSSKIEKKVTELLKNRDQISIPIDIYQVIEDLGIEIVEDDMEDDHSGFLLVENNRATIAINESHHPNRKRFTAAHELGHYMLHCHGGEKLFVDRAYNRNSKSSTGVNQDEIDANRFAAAILMPKSMLQEEFGDGDITDLDISLTALKFGVSEQALTLRLVNLGMIET